MYARTHAQTHALTHARPHTVHNHIRTVHTRTQACMHARTDAHMHAHTHARTHVHNIHTRMHSHTHTRLKLHDITHVHSNTRMNTLLYALYYYTHTFILKTRPVAVNCSLSCANSCIEMRCTLISTCTAKRALRTSALTASGSSRFGGKKAAAGNGRGSGCVPRDERTLEPARPFRSRLNATEGRSLIVAD